MNSLWSRVGKTLVCLLALAAPLFATTVVARIQVGFNPGSLALNPITKLLYTANDIDDTVSVVDTVTNTLVTTIPTDQPFGVAVNPNTNLIYVNTEPGVVYVIDGATNQVVTTIPTGNGADGIAVDSRLNRIYATNVYDNAVAVIDGRTNAVVDHVTVGKDPGFVAVDEVTGYVYVTNVLGASVSVIDGHTDMILATVSITGTDPIPNGIAVDHALNRVYVTDNGSFTLDVIDTLTFTVSSTVSGFENPFAVAINPQSHWLYVLGGNGMRGRISLVSPKALAITGKVNVRRTLFAAVVDPSTGYLYVGGGDEVVVFGP